MDKKKLALVLAITMVFSNFSGLVYGQNIDYMDKITMDKNEEFIDSQEIDSDFENWSLEEAEKAREDTDLRDGEESVEVINFDELKAALDSINSGVLNTQSIVLKSDILVDENYSLELNDENLELEIIMGDFKLIVDSHVALDIHNLIIRDARNSAIELKANSALSINSSSFINNRGERGASIKSAKLPNLNARNNIDLTIENSSFIDNDSINNGGAIYLQDGLLNIGKTVFEGNRSNSGGVIYGNKITGKIEDSVFVNNYSGYVGGAIYLFKSNMDISSSFGENTAANSGGALYIDKSNVRMSLDYDYGDAHMDLENLPVTSQGYMDAMLDIEDPIYYIKGNKALNGGGINSNDSTVLISGPKFLYNNALDSGGAIYYEGGERDQYTGFNINEHTIFYKNVASRNGGAIYFKDINIMEISPEYDFNRLWTYLSENQLGLSDLGINQMIDLVDPYVIFMGNDARNGGAIYIDKPSKDVRLAGIIFIDNTSSEAGGGLYINGELGGKNKPETRLDKSIFYNNVAKDGGAIYGRGIDISPQSYEFNNIFQANRARKSGGATYFIDSYVNESESIYLANESDLDGGAIYLKETYYYNSGTFADNKAGRHGGVIYAEDSDMNINGMLHDTDIDYYIANPPKDLYEYVEMAYENAYIASGNRAQNGGVVYAKNKDSNDNYLNIYANLFTNNIAEDSGGVIYFSNDSSNESSDFILQPGSIFLNNKSGENGGVVFYSGSGGFMSSSQGTENLVGLDLDQLSLNELIESLDYGALIFKENQAKYGGALYLERTLESYELSDIVFMENRAAEDGGAIYMDIGGPGKLVDSQNIGLYKKAMMGGTFFYKNQADNGLKLDDGYRQLLNILKEDEYFDSFAYNVSENYIDEVPNKDGTYKVAMLNNHDMSFATEPEYITVSLNGNGNTSGQVPSNIVEKKGKDFLVPDQGSLAKTAHTFAGWNTKPDGSGSDYQVGNSYSLMEDLSLYAKWIEDKTQPEKPDPNPDPDPERPGPGPNPDPGPEEVKPDEESPEIIPGGETDGDNELMERPEDFESIEIIFPEIPLGEKLNDTDHFAYIFGYKDSTVRPEENISREEAAAIFYRLLRPTYRDLIYSKDKTFKDVGEDRWSFDDIATLNKGGIVSGYPDGSFKPEKQVTRAEIAVMASKFENLKYDGENKFSDVDNHWAKYYINSAAMNGWLVGSNGKFRPDDYMTRAEFVTMVNSILDRRVRKENILKGTMSFIDLDDTKWYYEPLVEAANGHDYQPKRLEDGSEVWIKLLD